MGFIMRDIFRIFPCATAQERADLCSSIQAVGLRNPVVVDEHGSVIDGHERRDICIELGIDWLAGADVRIGLTEVQKKALAIELNLWRRPIHLTRKQRNELLDIYLIANPHLSETQVAELFGINQSTVNRRKRELMRWHKLPLVTATVGKDGITRRLGERRKNPARLIVKSRAEYESLKPVLAEVGSDLSGLVRSPKKLNALARRKRAMERVESAPQQALPPTVRIEHCDFRNLHIEAGSVDVILTDVVWSLDAQEDWRALASLAKVWLRPNGVFCSLIGNCSLPYFCTVIMNQLYYQLTISVEFAKPHRSYSRQLVEQWRPAPVFANAETEVVRGISDRIIAPPSDGTDKDFDDWQQSVPVSLEFLKRLTKPGDIVLDPQVGTGTNAVACSLLGDRTFIGCDIEERKVRTTRYRLATEGQQKSA